MTSEETGVNSIDYQVKSDNDMDWVDNYVSIDVDSNPQSYLVTTEVIGGGGEFIPSQLDAPIGEPASFELSTFEGYELLQVNGCEGSIQGNTYTTAPVDKECNVTAEFARLSYAVEFYDKGGELIESQTVLYGDSAVAPEPPTIDGYSFVGWSADFSSVTSDLTVTAEYKINQYRVSLWITGKGSVNPGGKTVDWGETALFELMPEGGYELYNVEGCGGELVREMSYQTGEIKKDCEVTVKFRNSSPRKSGLLMLIMATEGKDNEARKQH